MCIRDRYRCSSVKILRLTLCSTSMFLHRLDVYKRQILSSAVIELFSLVLIFSVVIAEKVNVSPTPANTLLLSISSGPVSYTHLTVICRNGIALTVCRHTSHIEIQSIRTVGSQIFFVIRICKCQRVIRFKIEYA